MLKLYYKNKIIFQSENKWLYPIFELEEFLKNFDGNIQDLVLEDSVIGKAAISLMIRLGIKNIHGILISKIALNFVNKNFNQINFSYESLVEKIKCQTEVQLENENNIEKIYYLIQERIKNSQKK